MTTSDGSTADYYELPAGATQLQDLISHRDMNAQLGEIFRAAYRYGIASHSGKLRDAKKIKFYIDAEIKRLDVLLANAKRLGCCETIEPADVEIAGAIEDDSERMQAIGHNDGEHYRAPDWSKAPDNAVLYIDWTESAAGFASSFYCDGGDRFYRLHCGVRASTYVLKRDDGLPDTNYQYFMRPAN